MFTGRACDGVSPIGCPSIRSVPREAVSKPPIRLRVVVLPQPLGPSSEKNSPLRISRSTRSSATTEPKRLPTSRSSTAELSMGIRGERTRAASPLSTGAGRRQRVAFGTLFAAISPIFLPIALPTSVEVR